MNLNTMFTKKCRDRTLRLNYLTKVMEKFTWEPQIFIMVQCYDSVFANPLTGEVDVDRQYLLYLSCLTDCLCVFLYMITIVFLEKSAIRAAAEFKDFNN